MRGAETNRHTPAAPVTLFRITEVLHGIPDHPSNRVNELLPWNDKPVSALSDAA